MAASTTTTQEDQFPQQDPSAFIPRIGQVQWDHYYMEVALTIGKRANCYGAKVGAVLVLHNRVISTGFNGTPAGFPNCLDGGCERCRQRELRDHGHLDQVTDPLFLQAGKHLDVCICVHAEANALLSAARYGTKTEQSTLYATHQPCLTCLKEAIQAGLTRVVYLEDWSQVDTDVMRQQYALLAEHLRANDQRNFERLARQDELLAHTGGEVRQPVLDDRIPLSAASTARPEKAANAPAGKRRVKATPVRPPAPKTPTAQPAPG